MTLDDVIDSRKQEGTADATPSDSPPQVPVANSGDAPASTAATESDATMTDSATPAAPSQPSRPYPSRGGRGGRRHQPYRTRGPAAPRPASTPEEDESRSRRVYVGNLAWEVTWQDLKDHMRGLGDGCEVTRADVLLTHDGRSKGCGLVEFATAEGARRAVLMMNDTELMGRQIFVREDREAAAPATSAPAATARSPGTAADSRSRRVYVGNLSWDVVWQDLKDHMREAGEVLFAEVMTGGDGRSKGCGIVEYATAEQAAEAISTLNDTDLNGRMIFVREDRETGGPSGGGGGYRGGYGGGGSNGCSVYVGNLPFETPWQDLKDHMRAAGNVDKADILTGEDGRSKGCAIVIYQKPQEAARAIRELQNSVLHGRPIFVREDREQGGGFRGRNRGGGGGNSRMVVDEDGGSGATQLFVGNLNYDTTWKDLKDHFKQCGEVDRADVMEGPDGRKKGYGTVSFFKSSDAQNAIRRLNGVELMGRPLDVKVDSKAN